MENLQLFDKFISLLSEKTGIIPLDAHKKSILKYIEKRSREFFSLKNEDDEESILKNYYSVLATDKNELALLINKSTVNETYFFRDERQFEFLNTEIFPKYSKNTVKIWSVPSSSGEEAYSLALLALSCNLKPDIIASDIDTNVLEQCKKGVYYKNKSLRNLDGKKFHILLEPYFKGETIQLSEDIKSFIQETTINLKEIENNQHLPEDQDIIFLRNVFIYFKPEHIKSILKTVTDKCLAENGYLFVSTSEIASITPEIMPHNLEKNKTNSVFYFRKKSEK